MSAGEEILEDTDDSKPDYDLDELKEADWETQESYLESVEKEWGSDAGQLYVRDTSDWDKDYDQRLEYLEDRSNPEVLATGEYVDETLEELGL